MTPDALRHGPVDRCGATADRIRRAQRAAVEAGL